MSATRAGWAAVILVAGLVPLVASPPAALAVTTVRPFDVNGDGYAELVVGVPGESVGTLGAAGALQVVRGSATGPTSVGNQVWTQDSAGMSGAAERSDSFGSAVASGDFDRDGYADVAVGVPGEDVGTATDCGAVQVMYGSRNGLTGADDVLWHQDSTGVPGANESNDRFGRTLAAGDVDGDGYADLAIGAPGEDVGAVNGAGGVVLLRGSATGLRATGSQAWNQDSVGVADVAEQFATGTEEFGGALAMGDIDADGRADLAIGVPGEGWGAAGGNGAVHVLRGSAVGLTASGSQYLTARGLGAGWPPRGNRGFGAALALGDFDRDGRADLAVGDFLGAATEGGTPTGTVTALRAGQSGAFGSSSLAVWHIGRGDVPGAVQRYDGFGAALGVGDFSGDGTADLAIGAPLRDAGSSEQAGAVFTLSGSASGLAGPAGAWTQQASAIPGVDETGDLFGWSVQALRLAGGSTDWLAIGAPGEAIGAAAEAGAVTVLRGSASGVTASAATSWHQDSPGIVDAVEPGDRLGALASSPVATPGVATIVPPSVAGKVITTVPTTAKVVALTFDGGAGAKGLPSILATLDSEHIRATFFLTGEFVRDFPSQVDQIVAAGHLLGNHSDTHPDFTTLPTATRIDQLHRAELAIRARTGSSTQPWFRFPFGASNAAAVATVNSQGYGCVGWTVDTLGWKGTSGGQSTSSVVARVVAAARPGEIVLMHVGQNPDDGTTLDADALPTMIDRLQALGYGFTTLDTAR